MGRRRWPAVLALVVAAGGLLAGCNEESGPPQETPGPEQDEALLRDLPFADIVVAGFGAQGITLNGETLRSADGSRFRSLGRLVGALAGPGRPEMAVFVDYEPSSAGATGSGAGVYVVFVALDAQREPAYQPLSLMAASGEAILPASDAAAQGVTPFRQGSAEGDAIASIVPALLLDLEGDGAAEMALRRQLSRNSVSWERLEVYQRPPGARTWTRVGGGDDDDAPALAVLHYWADVSAAVGIASRWEPEPRLVTVWSWLADEEATDPSQPAAELVAGGDATDTAETVEALRSLRSFFEAAHGRLSEEFRVRQPWPGFINGFKKTEAVRLLEVSAPRLQSQGKADLEVLLDLTEREGPKAVTRRLLVETELVREEDGWFLDGVEATEQRP